MPVTVAPVDLERLGRRFAGLQLRFAALQGRASELQAQRARLVKAIGLAKARIELAPQAMEVFTYLQEQAHARAVGEFEDLLSAFVADVVPDAGKVRLELGTERGAPALDILLDNGGDLENILEGNGGGLTNVVVTGLGFSALARTANRQLMVLDEPDCWLKSKYVPNFTKVIAEVANPRVDATGLAHSGCQTLMISHNDVSLMDEGAHIQDLRIERDLAAFADRLGVSVAYKGEVGDCAHVVWVPDSAGRGHIEVRYREDGLGDDEQNALTKGFPVIDAIGGARPWDADMPGIRWVEVANLRRHVLTRMELSPGLNVLAGDINGGKSTLYFTALRAMAYGETDDTMIRHGADSAVVRVGLEGDVVLEMVRSRKGSPKVLFRRYEAGKLVNEGRQETRGGVPEFISDALNISRVDNLDIQLRSQKEPIFLLNETAARRAQLLSVGRESGLLQALIERHRLQLRRDKEQTKRDEVELAQVSRTLRGLAPVGSMASLGEVLESLLGEARKSTAEVHKIRALVARMQPLAGRVRLAGEFAEELSQVVEAPSLPATLSLAALVAKLASLEGRARTHDAYGAQLAMSVVVPAVKATAPLADVLARLSRNSNLAKMPDLPSAPALPQLPATAPMVRLLSVIEAGTRAEKLSHLVMSVPVLAPLVDTAPIRRDGVALSKKQEGVAGLEKTDKELQAEVLAADEALHKLKHTLGVCPTCNHAFEDKAHA